MQINLLPTIDAYMRPEIFAEGGGGGGGGGGGVYPKGANSMHAWPCLGLTVNSPWVGACQRVQTA